MDKETENNLLTVGELKKLQVGDWVWIVALCDDYKTTYAHIVGMGYGYFVANYSGSYNSFNYFDYGTKWLVYRNKEESENPSYGNVKRVLDSFQRKIKEEIFSILGDKSTGVVNQEEVKACKTMASQILYQINKHLNEDFGFTEPLNARDMLSLFE